ncbi:MAG: hypothetical protein P8I42_06235 [Flavobacteriaceae bacterium]|nr:hypothetical protein [Flavobacteriaceae bacterium]
MSQSLTTKFIFIGLVILWSSTLFGQHEVQRAPEKHEFEWHKANGDLFGISVENRISPALRQKVLDRVCMQILLKSMLHSKTFEDFTSLTFVFHKDLNYNVAILSFTIEFSLSRF